MKYVELIIKLDTETYKAVCGAGVSYFETGMRNGKTLLSKLIFAIRKGTLLSNFGTYIAGYMDAIKALESKAGSEKKMNENELYNVVIMIMNHIRPDGQLSSFSYSEVNYIYNLLHKIKAKSEDKNE